jgi:DNA-binding PadR family transcriptional regulator
MILGLLARNGPRHGYQIRYDAEVTDVGRWGGVSVGALYRELRQMETETLLEAVRTEQIGHRPVRTIYGITPAGLATLRLLREQALTDLYLSPDAVGVALLFGGIDAAGDVLAFLRGRKETIERELAGTIAERERLEATGILEPLDRAVFRRQEFLRAAELQWFDEVEQRLTEVEGRRSQDAPGQEEIPG